MKSFRGSSIDKASMTPRTQEDEQTSEDLNRRMASQITPRPRTLLIPASKMSALCELIPAACISEPYYYVVGAVGGMQVIGTKSERPNSVR
jgi:hypothetical protein